MKKIKHKFCNRCNNIRVHINNKCKVCTLNNTYNDFM